jgi:hypothetical protein
LKPRQQSRSTLAGVICGERVVLAGKIVFG